MSVIFADTDRGQYQDEGFISVRYYIFGRVGLKANLTSYASDILSGPYVRFRYFPIQ